MTDKFVIHDKTVTDSGLYPWALGSIGRSLLFYAETIESKGNKPLETISAYYAIFHISMFAMFACPKILSSKERKIINAGIQNGCADPSPQIHHKTVQNFLVRCDGYAFPPNIGEMFNKLKKMRENINYGPRVISKPDVVFINSCEFPPYEENLSESLKDIFINTIEWTCLHGADSGIWIPELLRNSSIFFKDSDGVYVGWISEKLMTEADNFRIQLQAIAMEKLYPSSNKNIHV